MIYFNFVYLMMYHYHFVFVVKMDLKHVIILQLINQLGKTDGVVGNKKSNKKIKLVKKSKGRGGDRNNNTILFEKNGRCSILIFNKSQHSPSPQQSEQHEQGATPATQDYNKMHKALDKTVLVKVLVGPLLGPLPRIVLQMLLLLNMSMGLMGGGIDNNKSGDNSRNANNMERSKDYEDLAVAQSNMYRDNHNQLVKHGRLPEYHVFDEETPSNTTIDVTTDNHSNNGNDSCGNNNNTNNGNGRSRNGWADPTTIETIESIKFMKHCEIYPTPDLYGVATNYIIVMVQMMLMKDKNRGDEYEKQKTHRYGMFL